MKLNGVHVGSIKGVMRLASWHLLTGLCIVLALAYLNVSLWRAASSGHHAWPAHPQSLADMSRQLKLHSPRKVDASEGRSDVLSSGKVKSVLQVLVGPQAQAEEEEEKKENEKEEKRESASPRQPKRANEKEKRSWKPPEGKRVIPATYELGLAETLSFDRLPSFAMRSDSRNCECAGEKCKEFCAWRAELLEDFEAAQSPEICPTDFHKAIAFDIHFNTGIGNRKSFFFFAF